MLFSRDSVFSRHYSLLIIVLYTVNLSQDSSTQNSYLSTTLLDHIQTRLKMGDKTILYLNKRGAFSSVICEDCGYLFGCWQCDTSLSVHHTPERLLCHLCGNSEIIPTQCKQCNGTRLKNVWVGTEQVESALRDIFKTAKIYRFDSDSMKTKTSKQKALQDLRESDIIIGTKMITTGFDFDNVWLIGVILLEQELSYPQYNIEERVYTNLKQLIGRGERQGKQTDVVLQSFIPQNDFVKHVSEGNYRDFFRATLQERKIFGYPPFTEMVTLEYRDTQKQKAADFMQNFFEKLELLNENYKHNMQLVSLPFKKSNQYHYKIIIKWSPLKPFLQEIKTEIMKHSKLSIIMH